MYLVVLDVDQRVSLVLIFFPKQNISMINAILINWLTDWLIGDWGNYPQLILSQGWKVPSGWIFSAYETRSALVPWYIHPSPFFRLAGGMCSLVAEWNINLNRSVKGTVSIISNEPPCKDDNSIFTSVTFKFCLIRYKLELCFCELKLFHLRFFAKVLANFLL